MTFHHLDGIWLFVVEVIQMAEEEASLICSRVILNETVQNVLLDINGDPPQYGCGVTIDDFDFVGLQIQLIPCERFA